MIICNGVFLVLWDYPAPLNLSFKEYRFAVLALQRKKHPNPLSHWSAIIKITFVFNATLHWKKWPACRRCHFPNAFSWMKRILIQILLDFFAEGSIDNKTVLVQIMASCRIGQAITRTNNNRASHYLNQQWPSSLTHICDNSGRWVLKDRLVELR